MKKNNILKIVFVFLAIIISYAADAQELTVSSIELLQTDTYARTHKRLDRNDNPCALVRVVIPTLQGIVFNANQIIGESEYTPGEYLVYIPEGTQRLTLKHPNFEPCQITFQKGQIQQSNVYKVVLKLPENKSNTTLLRLVTNVQHATLTIGDKSYQTDNSEFNIPLTAGEYKYVVSSPIEGFTPYTGNVTITGKEIVQEEEKVILQTQKTHTLTIYSDKGTDIYVDGKHIGKSNGTQSVTLPAGIHDVEAKYGTSGNWYLHKRKDLTSGNDTLGMKMRGYVRITSPKDAEFSIEPIGESIAPEKKSFKSGQFVQLLGSYMITVKKKNYNTTAVRVNVGVEQRLTDLSINVTSEADNLYYGLNGKKMNREKAYKSYEKMATAGDEIAAYKTGVYWYDRGDLQKSVEMWKQAAMLGSIDAMKALYQNAENTTDKKKYGIMAAESGSTEAMVFLGNLYLGEYKEHADHSAGKESYRWYSKAYEEGTYSIAGQLGLFYYNGWEIPQDYDTAHKLFEEGFAEEEDNISEEKLADYNYYGIGRAVDKPSALRVYNRLANDGKASDDALYKLSISQYRAAKYANIYQFLSKIKDPDYVKNHNEMDMNVFERIGSALYESNPDQAVQFYLIAIQKGWKDAAVYSRLGQAYYRGRGVPKNIDTAITWLQPASNNKIGEASCFLGACYQDLQQYEKAFKSFQLAVKQGYPFANGYIGTMYSKGWYVKKDLDKAVSYWILAANEGHQQSIKNLIKYYEFKKDRENLERWKAKQK